MKKIITLLFLAVGCTMQAQTGPTAVVDIWEGSAPPTDNGLRGNEVNYGACAGNITKPMLYVYVPRECNGNAIISTPGGAYGVVFSGSGNDESAKWFTDRGFTFAILKYRLPNGHPTVPLEDFQRAITIMRNRAYEWGDYTSVGVMGHSAGGHLASTAATHFVDDVTRPDFQITLCPVISMEDGITHAGSRDNLIGRNPSNQLRDFYSNNLQVTTETPPAFIAQPVTDQTVSVQNALVYARALAEKGVPVTLCVYPKGTHDSPSDAQWEFIDNYHAELEKFLNSLPARESVGGESVAYTFDSFENEYRVLSDHPEGVTEADGKLTADESGEHFVVFESATPMNEFQVSCDIYSPDATYDAGIVMLASGETAADVKTSAHCVQIVGSRVRLQKFNAEVGKWKVLKAASFMVPAGGVNIKVLCPGNGTIKVYADSSSTPLFTYQMTEEEKALSGHVGLFANKNATVFDNFTIKSKQYKKK